MQPQPESDPRFPSGRWTGFFLDRRLPGKHAMEMVLNFGDGKMVGSGRDRVGPFTIDGAYDLTDGQCRFAKQYIGKHLISYRGFNEGKGIWGTWTLTEFGSTASGGFHIWPEGLPDPTQPVLRERVDEPVEQDQPLPLAV